MPTPEMLARLLPEFPPQATAQDNPEEAIRAALGSLVRRAAENSFPFQPIPEDPATCPNCGEPCDSARTPYCSEHCKETAAFVRQCRSAIEGGTIFERQRQIGLGQAFWKVQGGGYPLRQRMITPKVMAKVIERDGGLCSVCGAPATEVDHTGSG